MLNLSNTKRAVLRLNFLAALSAGILTFLFSYQKFGFASESIFRLASDPNSSSWRSLGMQAPFEIELRKVVEPGGIRSDSSTPILIRNLGKDSKKIPKIPSGHFLLRWRRVGTAFQTSWSYELRVFIPIAAPVLNSTASSASSYGSITLSWHPVDGVDQYLLYLHHEGSKDVRRVVKGNQFTFAKLKPGRFYWSVAALVAKSGDLTPTSVNPDFHWGEWATAQSFEMADTQRNNLAPVLIWPKGKLLLSNSVLAFNWRVAQPMSSYVLRLFSINKNSSKILLAEVSNLKEPFVFSPLGMLPPGTYQWQVLALLDSTSAPIESEMQKFEVERAFEGKSSRGSVMIGYKPARYTYSGNTSDFSNSFDAAMSGPSVSAQYFVTPTVGLSLSYSSVSYTFQSQTQTLSDVSIQLFKQFSLGGHWKLLAGAGFARESTPEVLATDNAYPTPDYQVGNSVRYFVVPNFELNYTFENSTQTYINAGVSKSILFKSGAESGGSLSGTSLPYRLSAGVRGAWFWPWGITMEGSLFCDNYSYTTSLDQVSISYQGYDFLVGLFYLF